MNDIKEITELKKTLDKISSICYTNNRSSRRLDMSKFFLFRNITSG